MARSVHPPGNTRRICEIQGSKFVISKHGEVDGRDNTCAQILYPGHTSLFAVALEATCNQVATKRRARRDQVKIIAMD